MSKLRISIIGPESSGKTTLAKSLADLLGIDYLPEFARKYLEENGSEYSCDDVLRMAQKQAEEEERYCANHNIALLDTDLYVYKVWLEVKYNRTVDWIERRLAQMQFDHHFICYPDIPWEEDSLREAPELSTRIYLFEMYEHLLMEDARNYTVLRGSEFNRTDIANQQIQRLIQEKQG